MRLAKKTHYGIQVLTYLADRPLEWVSLTTLAKELHISLPFLKHIASALKRGRIVASLGGMHGGYRISRPIDQLSLGSILKSLGEPIRLLPCKTKQCNHSRCLTGRFWESVNTNLQTAFDQTTLATIVRIAQTRSQ